MHILFFIFLLAKPGFADLARMSNSLQQLVFNSTHRQVASVFRALDAVLGDMLDNVNGYGCWCYFDGSGKGHGAPMNLVDAQCKQLHEGYECAVIDGEVEEEPCAPWLVDYTSATNRGEDSLVDECNENNSDVNQCARRACIVEGFFVIKMFQSFFDPDNNHDTNYLHSNGFEPSSTCIQQSAPSEYPKVSCCGNYPYRSPYRTEAENESRKCCGRKVYDATLWECCANDVISFACLDE